MTIGLLWLGQVALFTIGWLGPWRDAAERHTNGRVAWPFRMALSLSLVLAAALVWRGADARAEAYCPWIFRGMAASFVGDLIMARLIPLPNRLIGGMVAFALAHALYVAGYVQTLILNGGTAAPGLWIGGAFYGLATIGGWRRFIRNPEKPAAVNLAALAYGLWISVMASFAFALALALGGAWWLTALGGLAFVASDFIIGSTEIGGMRLHNANDWIWVTYVAGQMGIIYAGWF